MQNHSIFSALQSPLPKEWPPLSLTWRHCLCWAQRKGCCLPLQCNWVCPDSTLRSVKYKQKFLGETVSSLGMEQTAGPGPFYTLLTCFQPGIWIRWLTPEVTVNYEALLGMKDLAKDDNPKREKTSRSPVTTILPPPFLDSPPSDLKLLPCLSHCYFWCLLVAAKSYQP